MTRYPALSPLPPARIRWRAACAAAGLMMAAAMAQAQPPTPSDPRGHWVTANGNLEVEIAPCGEALCGTVTKVLGNRSMSQDGAEMNPVDKRPALGMMILHGFVPLKDHESGEPLSQWEGEIYNRENGRTYACQMSVSTARHAAGELILRAYVGLPLFGKTQSWLRAADDALATSRAD